MGERVDRERVRRVVVCPNGQVLGRVSWADVLDRDVGDLASASVKCRGGRGPEVGDDHLIRARIDARVGDPREGLLVGVEGAEEIRARPLLPEGGRASGRAGGDGIHRAVVGGGHPDHVIRHPPRPGPEAKRPARHHAALGVPDDVDAAVRTGMHCPDRIDDVLAGDLDIAHRVVGKGDGAERPAQLGQRRLPVPRVLDLRGQRRARNQQDRRPIGLRHAAVALQRSGKLVRRHAQRRAR
jgi:hypothetical protein